MGSDAMPIKGLLEKGNFTLEQRRVLEIAFNQTLRKLRLVDRNDPVCEIVAKRVIEVHKRGATNPVAICEIATRELGLSRD